MADHKRHGSGLFSQPSALPFSVPPTRPSIPLHPFKAHIPDSAIEDLQARLHSAPDITGTYENEFADDQGENYGMTKTWMEEALGYWRSGFDWYALPPLSRVPADQRRNVEREINSFPNYTTSLSTRGHTYTIHFVGLFSEKKDAVPVIMTHGWPGSILEFMPLCKHLTSTYSPADLPIHLIMPSLVGYGFSSPPPRRDNFSNLDIADLWDQLMRGLGFENYIAQGGDIGSFVARLLGEKYDGCRGVHVNLWRPVDESLKPDLSNLDDFDQAAMKRTDFFAKYEMAYNQEHSTKTGTIGIVVESSPVAMLAWIGEKFLVWSDEDPTLDQILGDVTLYWLTRTFASGLYHYRNAQGQHRRPETQPSVFKNKPLGYSAFPKELRPTLISVVAQESNLVWSKKHSKGGHFAALEQPEVLFEDLMEFIKVAWKAPA